MFLMCSNARAAENKVSGASAGSGAGNQKQESPSAATKPVIPILHTHSGFIEAEAIRDVEAIKRKTHHSRFASTRGWMSELRRN
jgi:hypothetical protein